MNLAAKMFSSNRRERFQNLKVFKIWKFSKSDFTFRPPSTLPSASHPTRAATFDFAKNFWFNSSKRRCQRRSGKRRHRRKSSKIRNSKKKRSFSIFCRRHRCIYKTKLAEMIWPERSVLIQMIWPERSNLIQKCRRVWRAIAHCRKSFHLSEKNSKIR